MTVIFKNEDLLLQKIEFQHKNAPSHSIITISTYSMRYTKLRKKRVAFINVR